MITNVYAIPSSFYEHDIFWNVYFENFLFNNVDYIIGINFLLEKNLKNFKYIKNSKRILKKISIFTKFIIMAF